jgi:hypothetical protein
MKCAAVQLSLTSFVLAMCSSTAIADEDRVLEELRSSHPHCVLWGHFFVSEHNNRENDSWRTHDVANTDGSADDFNRRRIQCRPESGRFAKLGDFGQSRTTYPVRAR